MRPSPYPTVTMLALLAACSAQPTRFHSLLPPPDASAGGVTTVVTPAIELLPINVAVAVDRPQWVLRNADGSQTMLEQERWIAPLADELHAALSMVLERAKVASAGAALPRWRVRLEIRRWDARLGGSDRLEAQWSVQDASAAPRTCQAVLTRDAGSTLDALAASHRALVGDLAQALLKSIDGC